MQKCAAALQLVKDSSQATDSRVQRWKGDKQGKKGAWRECRQGGKRGTWNLEREGRERGEQRRGRVSSVPASFPSTAALVIKDSSRAAASRMQVKVCRGRCRAQPPDKWSKTVIVLLPTECRGRCSLFQQDSLNYLISFVPSPDKWSKTSAHYLCTLLAARWQPAECRGSCIPRQRASRAPPPDSWSKTADRRLQALFSGSRMA